MLSYLKKYWLEIISFGTIFGVLLLCLLPDKTWINTDSDGCHYILSAKYMGVAHNTSAPLFLMLGRLFLWLPIGSDAWRMGLISVIATTICAIFIYKIVKIVLVKKYIQNNAILLGKHDIEYELTDNKRKLFGIIAALIYGSSAIVITQSTIIESYALSTMLAVIAYYSCIRGRWILAYISLGLVLAVHPLFFAMTWIVLIYAYKELRSKKLLLLTFSFILFYLYIPITRMFSDTPAMWGNTDLIGFLKNNFGTMWMLAGGIAIIDLPKRIIDTILILGISMGISLVVLIWYYINEKKLRSPLLWLFLIPIIYFVINLSAETYVYIMPAIAFGSIAVGIALSKVNRKIVYATVVVTIILYAYNAYSLDIGRTLDKNLSATKYYNEELPKLADGDIYLGGGWTWAIVYLYNKEEGRNIIPICTDILPSKEYLDIIEANGIKLTRTDSESFIDKQWIVAKSIAEQNDNVWFAEEINPKTLEYKLVPAKSNLWIAERWLGKEVEPTVSWKPSNPYDYITGALEVGEWKFILKSTHNARLAITFAVYAIFLYWLVLKWIDKRKLRNANKITAEEETR